MPGNSCEIQDVNFSSEPSCRFVPGVVKMQVDDMQLISDLTKHGISRCRAEPENLTILPTSTCNNSPERLVSGTLRLSPFLVISKRTYRSFSRTSLTFRPRIPPCLMAVSSANKKAYASSCCKVVGCFEAQSLGQFIHL